MIQTFLPSAGGGESLGGGTLVPAYSLSRFALAAATPVLSPADLLSSAPSSDDPPPHAANARHAAIVAINAIAARRPRLVSPIEHPLLVAPVAAVTLIASSMSVKLIACQKSL